MRTLLASLIACLLIVAPADAQRQTAVSVDLTVPTFAPEMGTYAASDVGLAVGIQGMRRSGWVHPAGDFSLGYWRGSSSAAVAQIQLGAEWGAGDTRLRSTVGGQAVGASGIEDPIAGVLHLGLIFQAWGVDVEPYVEGQMSPAHEWVTPGVKVLLPIQ